MKHVLLLVALAILSLAPLRAQEPSEAQEAKSEFSPDERKKLDRLIQSGRNEDSPCPEDGIAMGGYDPVSYFQGDEPLMGIPDYEIEQSGCTYRFATKENLETFAADPDPYLPAYGGWCATALAMGRLTCPDFTNYKVEDGKLLLFEVTAFTNGRIIWDHNSERLRRQADENFELLEKTP